MITPTAGHVLVTPILWTEIRAAELKKRSGLLLAQPDNKHTFEGIPNQGTVVALPDGYEGDLKVGAHVVFAENNPKGFKDPEDPERTLFALKFEQIIAEVLNDD